ncbi:MAG TPA: hypothetical protein VFP61_01350, partial [Acidimicrobiales bacterium]|nr:hypothetical protein [Acidimicrobiales bacterium]
MALQGSLRWWEAGPGHEAADDTRGVKANARLTAAVAVVLTALLVAEGLNLLVGVRQHLRWHVFVGAALVPPVAVKLGSVGWRFARYYRRDPPWVRKGPPPVVLRALGPLLVVLTVVLLGTGLMLVLAPSVAHATVLRLHKVSFVGWGGCFAVHFLGHLRETAWLARRDVARRSRGGVAGAG